MAVHADTFRSDPFLDGPATEDLIAGGLVDIGRQDEVLDSAGASWEAHAPTPMPLSAWIDYVTAIPHRAEPTSLRVRADRWRTSAEADIRRHCGDLIANAWVEDMRDGLLSDPVRLLRDGLADLTRTARALSTDRRTPLDAEEVFARLWWPLEQRILGIMHALGMPRFFTAGTDPDHLLDALRGTHAIHDARHILARFHHVRCGSVRGGRIPAWPDVLDGRCRCADVLAACQAQRTEVHRMSDQRLGFLEGLIEHVALYVLDGGLPELIPLNRHLRRFDRATSCSFAPGRDLRAQLEGPGWIIRGHTAVDRSGAVAHLIGGLPSAVDLWSRTGVPTAAVCDSPTCCDDWTTAYAGIADPRHSGRSSGRISARILSPQELAG